MIMLPRSPAAQLLQNLSFLSTSAPAMSSRMDPGVSRRATCDRKLRFIDCYSAMPAIDLLSGTAIRFLDSPE
jgi:hypothetical protein